MELSQAFTTARREASLLSRYFYVGLGVLSLFFVALGFSYTYFIPLYAGKFSAPIIFHIHGAMYFAWILLIIVQPLLVRLHHLKIHKRIGYAGFALAFSMFIIGIVMAIVSGSRTVSAGHADEARAFLIIPFTDMILFGTFIAYSLMNLKRPEAHKRLMIMATLAILPAAFGRIFGIHGIDPTTAVGFTVAILLQESLLILGVLHDLAVKRKVHPVYIWGGIAVVIIHVLRPMIGKTEWWMATAEKVIG